MKPRLFTGIQPTGLIHIGNYFGVIKNCIPLQDNYDSIFCIVDLHALTIKQNPRKFRQNIVNSARHYIASGIDSKKSILFIQSTVGAHSEFCWILNTLVKIPEMERMTQFKEKAGKNKENINLGLFSYPVLMAADILLYDTVMVPVGEDQKQHVELARTLAKRFNKKYGNILTIPSPLIKEKDQGSRIMGLDNPLCKMSKSADSRYNYISLLDDPELAVEKIMKAETDSGSKIRMGKDKPGISNLLTIYSLLKEVEIAKLEKKYQKKQYADFKKDLAYAVKDFLTDYQQKYQAVKKNQIAQILLEGTEKARRIAQNKMEEIKEAVGLV